jgi:hypothetical protein
MKILRRTIDEADRMERIGVAHKIRNSKCSNHAKSLIDGLQFSKKNVRTVSNVSREPWNKEISIVPKQATKTGTLRIANTTPVDIENKTRMILAIPFDPPINGSRNRILTECGAVDNNGILNIDSKAI